MPKHQINLPAGVVQNVDTWNESENNNSLVISLFYLCNRIVAGTNEHY